MHPFPGERSIVIRTDKKVTDTFLSLADSAHRALRLISWNCIFSIIRRPLDRLTDWICIFREIGGAFDGQVIKR